MNNVQRLLVWNKTLNALLLDPQPGFPAWHSAVQEMVERMAQLVGVMPPDERAESYENRVDFWTVGTVVHDGQIAHSATRCTKAGQKTTSNFCPRCDDWFEPARLQVHEIVDKCMKGGQ